MFFRQSARLLRRWTEDCDTRLLQYYDKYGPVWNLLASNFQGRNGQECRKRWLTLSGTLEAERYDSDKKLWLDGYERITLEAEENGKEGRKGWIKVPDIQKLPENPFEMIAKRLPKFKSSWLKKQSGWSEIELMALREGYEQYIQPLHESNAEESEINAAWDRIAKRFSRRTGTQCRNYFMKQHIFWNFQQKLKQVTNEIQNVEMESL